jgi:hypothetical protein
MARSFTAVPPDSTGDKLAMRTYPVGADTYHSQGVHFDGVPTYGLFIDNSAVATNKYHLYLRNDSGSNQTIYLTSLYVINLSITAVTGVVIRMDVRRVTGTPTLTAVTPFAFNSADPALAGVTAGTTVTAGLTDAQIIRPIILSTEEHTAAVGNVQQLVDTVNRLPVANDQERGYVLRPGEAIAIKQPTTATVGTLGFLLHFAVEPD